MIKITMVKVTVARNVYATSNYKYKASLQTRNLVKLVIRVLHYQIPFVLALRLAIRSPYVY